MRRLAEPEYFFLYLRHADAAQFSGEVAACNHDPDVQIGCQRAGEYVRQVPDRMGRFNLGDNGQFVCPVQLQLLVQVGDIISALDKG